MLVFLLCITNIAMAPNARFRLGYLSPDLTVTSPRDSICFDRARSRDLVLEISGAA